jgi:hypothetical protein
MRVRCKNYRNSFSADRPDRACNRGDPGEEQKDVFPKAEMVVAPLFTLFAYLLLQIVPVGIAQIADSRVAIVNPRFAIRRNGDVESFRSHLQALSLLTPNLVINHFQIRPCLAFESLSVIEVFRCSDEFLVGLIYTISLALKFPNFIEDHAFSSLTVKEFERHLIRERRLLTSALQASTK